MQIQLGLRLIFTKIEFFEPTKSEFDFEPLKPDSPEIIFIKTELINFVKSKFNFELLKLSFFVITINQELLKISKIPQSQVPINTVFFIK